MDLLGLEVIRNQPDAYDLVLMDMQMPAMDGCATAASLRATGHDRPIIALASHASRGDKLQCLGAGSSGYLTKPLDILTNS